MLVLVLEEKKSQQNPVKKKPKRFWVKELGVFSNGLKKDFSNTIVLLALLLTASLGISFLASILGFNDTDKVFRQVIEIKNTSIFLLAYLLVIRVSAEEIFFRGFLAKKTGVFYSSIAFGIAHAFYGSVIEIIGAFLLGLILAKAFTDNKNILPNIAAHFLYNAIIVSAVLANTA